MQYVHARNGPDLAICSHNWLFLAVYKLSFMLARTSCFFSVSLKIKNVGYFTYFFLEVFFCKSQVGRSIACKLALFEYNLLNLIMVKAFLLSNYIRRCVIGYDLLIRHLCTT